MTEKDDYALPLWIGPLLAVLCIGLKAGITLLLRAREEGLKRHAEAQITEPVDRAGGHVCAKSAVRL